VEEKSEGQVVQINDRRTSSGEKPEAAAAPVLPEGPKDPNAQVRPMVVPRSQLDPFQIIEQTGGSWREGRRAVMMLRDGLQKMARAATVSFRQIESLTKQLEERDVITHGWFSRPWWRRWFRRPPTLPGLVIPPIEGIEPAPEVQPQPPDPGQPQGPDGGTTAG
jgi:hypothetical protein